MVVLNGFYIGQHSGGYDPFSFDVSDFVYTGQRNVLMVRVDATQSDGWFYEGAGIYRHVWLVKTSPLHVKRWGTFVKSQLRPDEASLSILTEVRNDASEAPQRARDLDDLRRIRPDGRETYCRRRHRSDLVVIRAIPSRLSSGSLVCGPSKKEISTSWSPRFNLMGKSSIDMKRPLAFVESHLMRPRDFC